MRTRNAKLPLAVFIAVASVRGAELRTLVLGTLTLLLTYGFVAAFNDLHDVEADRLNRRDLPLATGELSIRMAEGVLAVLAILVCGLLLVWSSTVASLSVAGVAGVGFLYSAPRIRLSDRGFVGAATLAVAYVATPLVLATGVTDGSWSLALVVLVVSLPFAFATSLYKDFGDEAGDAAIGKMTPLLQHGASRVLWTGLLLWSVGGAGAALLSVYLGRPGWWIAAAVIGAALSASLLRQVRRIVIVGHRFVSTATIALLAASVMA